MRAARGRTELLVLSDRGFSADRLPIPSVLAVGAVNTALTDAGLRGRSDILVDAADILDVHSLAMALAAGATAAVPWLAVELAIETAGTRGAEELTADDAVANLLAAFEAGLRKTLARMGISTIASYIGGLLFETLELDADLLRRCFPGAPAWRGTVGLREIGERGIRRAAAAASIAADAPSNKLPDPGFARFKADGEAHLFSPKIAGEITALVAERDPAAIDAALGRYRDGPRRGSGGRRPAARSSATASGSARTPASAAPVALAVGRTGPRHRPPLRRLGDVGRRAVAGGPPGADDRDPAGRRRREHRRGRRGPGLVRADRERRAPRREDQAGRVGPVRRHRRSTSPAPTSSRSRSPRARSRARAASSRPGRRRPTSPRSAAASRG